MHPTLGRRLTAGLASSTRFGELPVLSALHVGDGGTLRCHVQREVVPGTWGVHRVEAEGLSAIGAVREGSTPVTWERAGTIIIDTGTGAFIPLAAAEDIEARGEEIEDFVLDTIDDALFGGDDDEAIVLTPGGQPMAVFQMIGDGTYGVMEGLDAHAAVCALVVIQEDEADG